MPSDDRDVNSERAANKSGRTSRWGRGLRRQSTPRNSNNDSASGYVPPSLDEDFVSNSPSGGSSGNLTTGISTLFRRGGSRERRNSRTSGVGSSFSSNATSDADATEVSRSPAGIRRPASRLFYSDDVSSDDSYESRVSTASSKRRSHDVSDVGDQDEVEVPDDSEEFIHRYRGFSTSIKSLFLDESLVCASMGCFGLILSHRTEHLLQLRMERKGDSRKARRSGKKVKPSNIMAYTLLITWLLIGCTFVVWGFGSGLGNQYAEDYEEGYDLFDDLYEQYEGGYNDDQQDNYNDDGQQQYNGNDDGQNNNRRDLLSDSYHRRRIGIFGVRDAQELLWQPFADFVRDEWYRQPEEDRNIEAVHRGLDQSYDDANVEGEEEANGGRNIGATIRSGLLLAFLVLLGVVGRRRRMRTRYALVKARTQEDQLYHASSLSRVQGLREDHYEGACSHTLCGCYPVDPPEETPEEDDQLPENSSDSLPIFAKKKRRHEDCVSRGFNCLMSSCCGVLCKCWFQCLSVCALAQEAREIRVLLPPRYQRIDFITLQPFSDYQKNVNDLRRGWLGKTRRKVGLMPHWHALSRLSRYILVVFSCTFVVIVLTLIFNPRASFSWNDAIVLIATFVQSFLVLYVVHWIFHKSDLSLDAVIKFFAAGFLIAIPTAFVIEGLLVNMILATAYSLYGIIDLIFGEVFVDWIVSHYRLLLIVGELLNAFVVAAVTEELCKYYTFRAVEHPDLIFLTGLDRKAQDRTAVKGGHVNYPFGGHQVSKLNRSNSFGSEYSHRSSVSSSRKKRQSSIEQGGISRTTTEEEFFEDENDVRTYRQKAAAVTTGMISVAVGLACAENFLYIFFLGGAKSSDDGTGAAGLLQEWIVLFFRSIFPIHALSAAMQSVNMIRKFVECSDDNSHRIGVGRIILPAVILHGTFDSILLGINVYVESAWDRYLEDNNGNADDGQPYNPVVLDVIAWVSIILIMGIGILWYYRENRSQRLRLILMEEQGRANEAAEENSYIGPSAAITGSDGHGEMELV